MKFVRDGCSGHVEAVCEITQDPSGLGASLAARGLPHLTARVTYEGYGYKAFFGWVQLVRSTDNLSGSPGFEPDPFALFRDTASPYCFFGHEPTLFDAPARASRIDLAWLAHAFLAYTPLAGDERVVVPLLGFSWGFDTDADGHVAVQPIVPLASGVWERHQTSLAAAYPGWSFTPTLPELNLQAHDKGSGTA